MIIEQGIVEEIRGRKALVRIQKSAACAGCPTRDSCEVGSDRPMRIEVANDPGARVGDRVEISMPAATLMKLSLMVYFLPVVALVAGAVTGNALAGYLHADPTAASVAGGGLAMAMTYFVLKWMDRGAGVRETYRPRMTRVFHGSGPHSPLEKEPDL